MADADGPISRPRAPRPHGREHRDLTAASTERLRADGAAVLAAGAKHHRWAKPPELVAVLAFLVSEDVVPISGAAIPVYGRA